MGDGGRLVNLSDLIAVDLIIVSLKGVYQLLGGLHRTGFCLWTRTMHFVGLGTSCQDRAPDHPTLVAMLFDPPGKGNCCMFFGFQWCIKSAIKVSDQVPIFRNEKTVCLDDTPFLAFDMLSPYLINIKCLVKQTPKFVLKGVRQEFPEQPQPVIPTF